jgi:hypothetical protein
LHPQVASVSCEDCQVLWYDENWQPVTRGGQHRSRPAGTRPPCRTCPKIPPGVEPKPENAVEVTEQVRRCYDHFKECRAVRDFPHDPLVRRHAMLFEEIEQAAERKFNLDVQLISLGNLLKRF